MVHLARRTISGTIPVDSALLDKSGRCSLQGYTKQADFYIVYVIPGHYINLIINQGDDFRVLTDAAAFDRNYIVEGSKDSRLIQKMVHMQVQTLGKITEISDRYENSIGSSDFGKTKAEIDSIYKQTVADHKAFSVKLIEENRGSLASLMALYQQLGRNEPVFDYKKDFKYYEMVDSNLVALYPNAEAVIDLNRKVTELRELITLEIGAPAPEIVLPDSTGRKTSLSSLKGKNVLILFWASWSDEACNELARYATFYHDAAKSNVEYYQVSLDKTRASWVKAIAGKTWGGIHVSDFKYWDSPAAQTYHIHKVPSVFLVNPKGKIIKKGFTADEFAAIIKDHTLE